MQPRRGHGRFEDCSRYKAGRSSGLPRTPIPQTRNMKHRFNAAITVGCDGALLSRLNLEFEHLGAVLEAEFPDTPRAIESLLLSLTEARIFVVSVKTADDLPHLTR